MPTKNMSRNWERYDSENAEKIEARLVHLDAYIICSKQIII